MSFLNDELEHGIRMCLASLYEHEPRQAGLFLAFGPWTSGEITPFTIAGAGERKLKCAFTELGEKFELHTVDVNSQALQAKYGVKAALAMHWLLLDSPPFEEVIVRILEKAEEEVPRCRTAPENIEDVVVISEALRGIPG